MPNTKCKITCFDGGSLLHIGRAVSSVWFQPASGLAPFCVCCNTNRLSVLFRRMAVWVLIEVRFMMKQNTDLVGLSGQEQNWRRIFVSVWHEMSCALSRKQLSFRLKAAHELVSAEPVSCAGS